MADKTDRLREYYDNTDTSDVLRDAVLEQDKVVSVDDLLALVAERGRTTGGRGAA